MPSVLPAGGELAFSNVTRRFGSRAAVDAFSVVIAPGETLCLLGPSGCGKTTTLRIAAGLERADAGEIRIDGRLMDGAGVFVPPERRGVGLMFQDFALFPHLRVAENVAFGLRELAPAARLLRAHELLEHVGMARFARSYPHELSGGEQQRVALARALAPNPRILLMDEPFSGLDPLLRDQVRGDTFALLRKLGTTVLLVTHDPREAMDVGDRIALMRAGRIAQIGAAADMFDHPVDREAASFFGDLNVIHAFVAMHKAPTAFGSVPALSLAEGTEVEVLVRPQAFVVNPAGGGGALAHVISSRRAGSETVLELELERGALPAGTPAMPLLRARLPVRNPPQPGEKVRLEADLSRALVFPCQQRAGGPRTRAPDEK